MEKQIYGNITNTARSQFQFDKIYPSRLIMDGACKDDGIYAGRYVLVEYGEDSTKGAIELIKKGNVFYYADFPEVIATPIQVKNEKDEIVIERTLAVGKICYAKENDFYVFYEATAQGFIPYNERIPVEDEDRYHSNWKLDFQEYKRGFDSTVWQKIYIDGIQKYIMIAELNTMVPNVVLSPDAPTEIPSLLHIDKDSDNLNLNVHTPVQWGFRIGKAQNPNLSDEKISHEKIIYDENGREQKEIVENVAADIFYNKDSLIPYNYLPITISQKDSIYEPNKYYYKLDYGVYKKYTEQEWEENFNGKNFYEPIKNLVSINPELKKYDYDEDGVISEKDVNIIRLIAGKVYSAEDYPNKTFDFDGDQKITAVDANLLRKKIQTPDYYTDYEKNELTLVNLLQSYEQNYKPGTFYILSEQTFRISIENFNSQEQYYKRTIDEDGKALFSPIDLTPETYVAGDYYTRILSYEKEQANSKYSENKQYFIEKNNNYEPIEISNKPEYEPNRYYAWVDTYYVCDDSEEQVKDRQYYELLPDGRYQEIEFKNRKYLQYTYFYKENDEYILDKNENPTEGREYYRRAIPAIRETEDKITILPTGISGRIYNHGNGDVQKDIQEISIMLPTIGKVVAEIWNLIYGKNRNNMIYDSPFYDADMYKENGESLYESNLNSFIGVINYINDFIGHNMVELETKNSISITNGKVYINNILNDRITEETIDRYIYKVGEEYYRAIVNEKTVILVSMSSGFNPIDNIYETILQIQKGLGLNEEGITDSTNTIKGALRSLSKAIEELNGGFEFISVGEGLIHDVEQTWRSIDGVYLTRNYNSETFVSAQDYDKEFEKYFKNKLLTPYSREVKTNITSNNFKEYWIETVMNGKTKYIHPETYSSSMTYYNFNKLNNFESAPIKDDLKDIYIIDLPVYYMRDEQGNQIPKEVNIFEDVIGIYSYAIAHANPEASTVAADNKNYEMLSTSNNRSIIKNIQVNKKGHVYGINNSQILPQAIVASAAPENVPIGTLWYDTSAT